MKTKNTIFKYITKVLLLSALLFPKIVLAAQSDNTLFNAPTSFYLLICVGLAGIFHAISIRTALNNNLNITPYVFRYLAIGTIILSILATAFHIYNYTTFDEFLSDSGNAFLLIGFLTAIGFIIFNSHKLQSLVPPYIFGLMLVTFIHYEFFHTPNENPTAEMYQSMRQVQDTNDVTKYYRNKIVVYSSKSDYYSNSPESFRLGYIEPINSNQIAEKKYIRNLLQIIEKIEKEKAPIEHTYKHCDLKKLNDLRKARDHAKELLVVALYAMPQAENIAFYSYYDEVQRCLKSNPKLKPLPSDQMNYCNPDSELYEFCHRMFHDQHLKDKSKIVLESMDSAKSHEQANNTQISFRLKKFIPKNTESSISIFDNTKLSSDRFYMRLAKKHEIEILMEKVQDGQVVLEDTSISDTINILRNSIEK